MKLSATIVFCFLTVLIGYSQSNDSSAVENALTQQDDYVLQPLDLVEIKVYQEPDMDREVRVSREGMIALPLIGRISVQGKSVRAVENLIKEQYDRDYLVNPQINIVIREYARRTVNVMGSVGTPGEVSFPTEEGLTLLDAISRAGGFVRLSDRRKIKLTRTLADGTVESFIINGDDLIGGDSDRKWELKTNDIIFVPERIL